MQTNKRQDEFPTQTPHKKIFHLIDLLPDNSSDHHDVHTIMAGCIPIIDHESIGCVQIRFTLDRKRRSTKKSLSQPWQNKCYNCPAFSHSNPIPLIHCSCFCYKWICTFCNCLMPLTKVRLRSICCYSRIRPKHSIKYSQDALFFIFFYHGYHHICTMATSVVVPW